MNWADSHDPARVFDGLDARAHEFSGREGGPDAGRLGALWEALHPVGVSWIGFYEIAGENNAHGADPGRAMVLGPHRDKPACSPIGLNGACGRAWRERRTLVIADVAHLGDGYVACDPRDRSELVIPCFHADGSCWGVLDADSFDAACFDEFDAWRLATFLVAAGLSAADRGGEIDVI